MHFLDLARTIVTTASILVIGAVALPCYAYRAEFLMERNGARVAGSQVCFFAGSTVKEPIPVYLQSNDVRCLPADSVIDMPPGVWIAYGRHSDGLITPAQVLLHSTGPAAPEAGYKAIAMSLGPAATIDVSAVRTAENEHIVVHVPNDDSPVMVSSYFPVPAGEHRMLIPAGRPALAVVVKDGIPVRFSEPFVSREGLIHSLADMPPPAQTDVVAWIRIDPEMLSRVEGQMAAPHVSLTAAGRTIPPLFTAQYAATSVARILFFKDVPKGAVALTVSGELWEHDELAMATSVAGMVRVASRGLRTAPASAIRLSNSSIRELRDAARSLNACRPSAPVEPSSAVPKFELRVLSCLKAVADSQRAPECKLDLSKSWALSEETDDTEVLIGPLSPGLHTIEFRPPMLPPSRVEVGTYIGKVTDLGDAVALKRIIGTVAEGGKPLRASVRFASGAGASDEVTGAFTSFVIGDPRENVVDVIPCDGSAPFSYWPREAIVEGKFVNIVVPRNQMTVTVTAEETGRPVERAEVDFAVLPSKESEEALYFGPTRNTDADGIARFTRIETERWVSVCATAKGYHRKCSDSLTLADESRIEVSLTLTRDDRKRGQLKAASPVQWGTIYWATPAGVVTESSNVDTDQSFLYSGSHENDIAFLVSRNLPLTTLVADRVLPDTFTPIVAAPVNIKVSLRGGYPETASVLTLVLGELQLPIRALNEHMSKRGIAALVQRGSSTVIPDIAGLAQIKVLVGISPELIRAGALRWIRSRGLT